MRTRYQMGHFCSLPLKQMVLAEPQPVPCANDRIDREICLVRQKSGHHDYSVHIAAGFMQGAHVTSESLRQTLRQLNEKRNQEHRRDQYAGSRRSGVEAPTANQE